MIIKQYTTTTPKINNNLKISIFSDIHYSNIFKTNKFKKIKQSLINEQPNYIFIPGDIIDKTNILDSEKRKK